MTFSGNYDTLESPAETQELIDALKAELGHTMPTPRNLDKPVSTPSLIATGQYDVYLTADRGLR